MPRTISSPRHVSARGGIAAGVSALLALALSTPGPLAAAPSGPEAPNIIFVLTDDQRYDALGMLDSRLHTPNLDRLASEGALFDNAFVTTSLCSPSRASIMSGQAMRHHGVVDNNSPMPEDFEPFAVALDAAGYDTAFIGKWHMGSSDASPKPGFDHWVSFEGQGSYAPVNAFGAPVMLNVNGAQVPQAGYITDELTERALGWLGERGADPYLLVLSHKAAHLPFTPAARHEDAYADQAFATPPSQPLDAHRGPVPMWVIEQRNSWHGVEFPYYSDRSLEAIQRDYYATLSAVDESMGALMAHLEAQDGGRDTVIIYTSDNGFMFGEHGLIDKRAAYEASIRVPLIIHGPGRVGAGRRIDTLARNIDVAPTILDLAGLPPSERHDGRSLLPVLAESAAQNGPALVYEYYWEFNYPQTPSTFALRDVRYKYVQYHGVWDTEELFDLESDPHELHNLIDAADQQQRVIAMREALYEALNGAGERPQIPFTRRYNQGAVFYSRNGRRATPFPERWARDPSAEDVYEHIVPDGPDKSGILRAVTPTLRRSIGGAEDGDSGESQNTER